MDLYSIFKKHKIEIDKDVFDYGYLILKNYCIVFILSLLFSFLFRTLPETFIFLFSFLCLRKYIGGFHFSNSFYCNFFSTLLLIVIPVLIKYFLFFDRIWIVLIALYSIIMFIILGPLDHPKKRINSKEKIKYKQKGLIIEFSISILALVCNFFGIELISNCVCASMICTSIFQLSTIIKRKFIHLELKK